MLMPRSLDLSTFAIILSLTFRGIVGMLMSVPITVVIRIGCSHVESLKWFAIVLSGDGAVTAGATDG